MGNPASKIGEEIREEEATTGSVPSTPILTPKHRVIDDLDPRSPSAHITRTPVQLLLSPEADTSKTVEAELEDNGCDTFNINSPAPKSFAIDPRSPTVEFARTPIVIQTVEKLPEKLHNKNLDNVRKTLLNVTPKKISDMSSYVPPKLLESSPLTLRPIENKRKSLVGLLETNLDYVETDLDEVIQNKLSTPVEDCQIKRKSASTDELKAKFFDCDPVSAPISVVENEDADPRSPTGDFLRTPIQIVKKIGEIDLNEDDANVDDDGLVCVKQDAPKIVELTPKLIEKKNKVQDFDRKISTLIYTDEDAVEMPRNVTVKEGNRTPLGIRNGQPRKSIPKLKVSDRPRKSEYAVSKIPVFKDKKGSENVPPKSMHRKLPQWDNDNTLII